VTYKQLAQRFRVSAGFALAPLLLITARPTRGSLIAGAAFAVAGLALRGWASGHLKKNQELTISGPYAYTRNPLYLGTLILGTGVAVAGGAIWFVALFIALYLAVYAPVMSAEAETVRRLFPQQYEAYSSRVPLFFPRLTPYRLSDDAIGLGPAGEVASRGRTFDAALYLRHREYRAALGSLTVFALLAAKLYLIMN
jgi:phospholipid methyltransferase